MPDETPRRMTPDEVAAFRQWLVESRAHEVGGAFVTIFRLIATVESLWEQNELMRQDLLALHAARLSTSQTGGENA